MAPYWTDLDLRCGGADSNTVLYYETNQRNLLDIAQRIARGYAQGNFVARSLTVITWNRVNPYYCGSNPAVSSSHHMIFLMMIAYSVCTCIYMHCQPE